ncbi:MAG TPA: hypothetical protein VK116_00770, partial [Planctomycetota bacterium]|nr:hypothetical protein [Planctomycetota bacterium]
MNRIRRASGRALLSLALLLVGALPLRADLVGWWPFDDDVDDRSGNENHGFHFAPTFDSDVPDA